jgi:hypothetical protein
MIWSGVGMESVAGKITEEIIEIAARGVVHHIHIDGEKIQTMCDDECEDVEEVEVFAENPCNTCVKKDECSYEKKLKMKEEAEQVLGIKIAEPERRCEN